jgi:hypothetical protein
MDICIPGDINKMGGFKQIDIASESFVLACGHDAQSNKYPATFPKITGHYPPGSINLPV